MSDGVSEGMAVGESVLGICDGEMLADGVVLGISVGLLDGSILKLGIMPVGDMEGTADGSCVEGTWEGKVDGISVEGTWEGIAEGSSATPLLGTLESVGV